MLVVTDNIAGGSLTIKMECARRGALYYHIYLMI